MALSFSFPGIRLWKPARFPCYADHKRLSIGKGKPMERPREEQLLVNGKSFRSASSMSATSFVANEVTR